MVGRLEPVKNLRDIWAKEAKDFATWLANNIVYRPACGRQDSDCMAHPILTQESVGPMCDMTKKFTALITKEENWYLAHCVELEVVSQGKSIEEAKANLKEAVELYLESFGEK
jgi:predicted RNase H-like HicB family nuclease